MATPNNNPLISNLNNLKNGSRLTRLTIGNLPKPLTKVQQEARRYRMGLEQAVLDAYGGISATQAHHIDTAAQCMTHAGICRWLLRQRLGEMTMQDILSCSKSMVWAKQYRDAAVRNLELDGSAGLDRELDRLYAPLPPSQIDDNERDDPKTMKDTKTTKRRKKRSKQAVDED